MRPPVGRMTFKSFVALEHKMFSILPLSSFTLKASYSRVPFPSATVQLLGE